MAEVPPIKIKWPTPAEMAEALRPLRLFGITAEVIEEVSKARRKHGPNTALADGTGPGEHFLADYDFDHDGIPNWQLEEIAKAVTDFKAKTGEHTRAQILFEEFMEAVAAGRPGEASGRTGPGGRDGHRLDRRPRHPPLRHRHRGVLRRRDRPPRLPEEGHPMRISDLMDVKDLGEMIHQGYVRTRSHPTSPGLMILNYTEKAQYERVWNLVTGQCRGLIVTDVHDGDGEIVARPFDKFFNYGEIANALDPTARVEVTDKADGSLGILFFTDETGWRIATRGSFESEQAIHATALLRRKYLARWAPKKQVTYLFEIVYPENRIVLDYGDQDDLILLGARSVTTGTEWGPDFDRFWPGPRVQVFEHETLAEALEEPDRRNAEGLVVRFLDDHAAGSFRIKIKQEDYVRLHKLVTGLNEKSVWEHLAGGGSLPALVAEIPDEFHEWVTITAENLWDQFDDDPGPRARRPSTAGHGHAGGVAARAGRGGVRRAGPRPRPT